jgi:hypothetical protein
MPPSIETCGVFSVKKMDDWVTCERQSASSSHPRALALGGWYGMRLNSEKGDYL